ncbi:MAG: adenylosuccinate synthase [Chloroflexi bacterium]|nr:adenylosuccinate synthase [Chloroflexota bacterium]
MPVVAVVGAQWGDEGKGKIIDLLAEKAQVVCRYSGGNNAGHTVVNPHGEFKLHLVPSGIFYPATVCVIGNGVVIDAAALIKEMDDLQSRGISVENLRISDRAHLVMPYHILLDGLDEDACGEAAIGTTRRGVGPAYVDKAARLGIRMCDLLDRQALRLRLSFVLSIKNALLTKIYGIEPLSLDDIYERCCSFGERLGPFVEDTEIIVHKALDNGEMVLLEGAQGSLLDVDFGTYPYVTSSHPISGGACSGLGLSPSRIQCVVGVAKAYNTRVGHGPMPSEIRDQTGELIRERAHEYGATTGRPRRCGWFDAVATRYSARINGFTGMALTRLDVLDVLPVIKVCTGYLLDGKAIDYFPASSDVLKRCQPVYEELPGWQTSTAEARSLQGLPPPARRYVARLEELVSCPIDIISVGARREQTIIVKPLS